LTTNSQLAQPVVVNLSNTAQVAQDANQLNKNLIPLNSVQK
jgi:hypothetical protein